MQDTTIHADTNTEMQAGSPDQSQKKTNDDEGPHNNYGGCTSRHLAASSVHLDSDLEILCTGAETRSFVGMQTAEAARLGEGGTVFASTGLSKYPLGSTAHSLRSEVLIQHLAASNGMSFFRHLSTRDLPRIQSLTTDATLSGTHAGWRLQRSPPIQKKRKYRNKEIWSSAEKRCVCAQTSSKP